MATIVNPAMGEEARERRFFLVMTVVISVLTVAGFALNLGRGMAVANPPAIYHIHALAFIGWLALSTAQATLIVRGDVRRHRVLGMVALAWLPVLVILGLA